MKKPADYLAGVSSIGGVPVVRTIEQQLRTSIPHIMCYPDGSVRVIVRSTESREWDPTVPIRKQIA